MMEGPNDYKIVVPRDFDVTKLDIFLKALAIILPLADHGSDIKLACSYYASGEISYFLLTILFTSAPAIYFFLNEYFARDSSSHQCFTDESQLPLKKKVFNLVLHACLPLLGIYPAYRNWRVFHSGLSYRRAKEHDDQDGQKKFYAKTAEDTDVASFSSQVECYLEAAPQSVLQLTILLTDLRQARADKAVQQGVSIATSFASMAWGMVSRYKSVQFAAGRKQITWKGMVVQLLWHLNVTTSRILSVSMVLSLYPMWTGLALGIHWVAMTAWIAVIDQASFSSGWDETLLVGAHGLIFIFNHIRRYGRPSGWQYLVYYPVCLVENLAAVSVWAVLSDGRTQSTWYCIPLISVPPTTFLLGMGFLALYYAYFHPSKTTTPEENEMFALISANLRAHLVDSGSLQIPIGKATAQQMDETNRLLNKACFFLYRDMRDAGYSVDLKQTFERRLFAQVRADMVADGYLLFATSQSTDNDNINDNDCHINLNTNTSQVLQSDRSGELNASACELTVLNIEAQIDESENHYYSACDLQLPEIEAHKDASDGSRELYASACELQLPESEAHKDAREELYYSACELQIIESETQIGENNGCRELYASESELYLLNSDSSEEFINSEEQIDARDEYEELDANPSESEVLHCRAQDSGEGPGFDADKLARLVHHSVQHALTFCRYVGHEGTFKLSPGDQGESLEQFLDDLVARQAIAKQEE